MLSVCFFICLSFYLNLLQISTIDKSRNKVIYLFSMLIQHQYEQHRQPQGPITSLIHSTPHSEGLFSWTPHPLYSSTSKQTALRIPQLYKQMTPNGNDDCLHPWTFTSLHVFLIPPGKHRTIATSEHFIMSVKDIIVIVVMSVDECRRVCRWVWTNMDERGGAWTCVDERGRV